jgi:lipopolysaccharide export LptBFGC system permease protein LptF
MKVLLTTVSLAGISFLTASPALAGAAAPGPLLAAGAPALALFAGGYYLIRRRRQG